jgi:hypothetical protein
LLVSGTVLMWNVPRKQNMSIVGGGMPEALLKSVESQSTQLRGNEVRSILCSSSWCYESIFSEKQMNPWS